MRMTCRLSLLKSFNILWYHGRNGVLKGRIESISPILLPSGGMRYSTLYSLPGPMLLGQLHNFSYLVWQSCNLRIQYPHFDSPPHRWNISFIERLSFANVWLYFLGLIPLQLNVNTKYTVNHAPYHWNRALGQGMKAVNAVTPPPHTTLTADDPFSLSQMEQE